MRQGIARSEIFLGFNISPSGSAWGSTIAGGRE
jgi:hypothetical protein